MNKGFAVWLTLLLVALIAGAGIYFYSIHQTTPVTNSTQVVNTTTPPISVNQPSTTTASTTSNLNDSTTSNEVPATISVVKNYQNNPLSIAATCMVNTTATVYALDFANRPGEVSAQTNYPPVPVSHSKTFYYTYPAPGTYTLECVPVYDPNANVTFNTPYVGKKTITLGGYAQPSTDNITFSFSPTTGTLPLQVKTSCSINTTGNVTWMAIGSGNPDVLVSGQTLLNKYIAVSDNSSGVSHTISFSGTVPVNNFPWWNGVNQVYCGVQINNSATTIVSNPIQINFQ